MSASITEPEETNAQLERFRVSGPHRARANATFGAQGARVSVIIPTLNEARNLPHVMGELPAWLDEVIIVDGHSTDGTPKIAQEILPSARVIYQPGQGKGDALRSGFAAASGDILVMLDADGSADPAEIPRFLQALLAGADFAKGSRFTDGAGSDDITRVRRVGNRLLSGTVNVLFGTRYSDLCYGYNAFWRHCLPAIRVDCNGFEVETLINIRVARAGLKVAEVPSYERVRIHGESNLHAFRDGAKVLRTIARERVRRRPSRPEHDWLEVTSAEWV
ncbi:MAG TPA: glycosyltransferase family 2 protein [Solirubrobacteraceae bacterium]|nr:glycosyltransferase family 2 protein [Solirubrobacteraceae bacterium]